MSKPAQRNLLAQFEDPNEHKVRQKWRHLVGERLPRAALERDWPITNDHCFARILLDVTLNRPWREAVRPPAWRHTPICKLAKAISLGEALLHNTQSVDDLNKRSLSLRRRRGNVHRTPCLDVKTSITSRQLV